MKPELARSPLLLHLYCAADVHPGTLHVVLIIATGLGQTVPSQEDQHTPVSHPKLDTTQVKSWEVLLNPMV